MRTSYRDKRLALTPVVLLMTLVVLAGLFVLRPTSNAQDNEFSARNHDRTSTARPGSKLKWAKPRLHNPRTIRIKSRGSVSLVLSNHRDYRIKLPNRKRVGATRIVGGRNIVIIGGRTTLPKQTADGDRNFTIVDGYGQGVKKGRIVHLEGLRIDGSGGGQGDGIGIKAPKAIVQLQNIRAVGLHGSSAGVHADVVQVYGGVKALRIDKFTGASHYNGLYLRRENSPLEPPTGPTRISRTNMFGYVNRGGALPPTTIRALAIGTQPADSAGGPGNDSSATNCQLTHNVYLSNFYGNPPRGVRASAFVYPWDRMEGAARSCSAKAGPNGRRVDWPQWRDRKVFGYMQKGSPPRGDYVKRRQVGVNYRSPGYRN